LSGGLRLLQNSVAADREGEEDLRRYPPGDGIVSTRKGSFLVAGRTGIVRLVGADGRPLWRYDAAGALSARPLVSEKLTILVTRAGRVIALEL
jgi:hypothetical protein